MRPSSLRWTVSPFRVVARPAVLGLALVVACGGAGVLVTTIAADPTAATPEPAAAPPAKLVLGQWFDPEFLGYIHYLPHGEVVEHYKYDEDIVRRPYAIDGDLMTTTYNFDGEEEFAEETIAFEDAGDTMHIYTGGARFTYYRINNEAIDSPEDYFFGTWYEEKAELQLEFMPERQLEMRFDNGAVFSGKYRFTEPNIVSLNVRREHLAMPKVEVCRYQFYEDGQRVRLFYDEGCFGFNLTRGDDSDAEAAASG